MNYSNATEYFGFIPYMIEDERTILMQLPFYSKIFMITIVILSNAWASLLKVFIYYNLAQEKFKERPINVLILVDQVIQHIFNAVVGTAVVLKLILNYNLPNCFKVMTSIAVNDRAFCIGYSMFVYFMLAYASVGSMGIALYRVLFIKATNWVKGKIGERRLLFAICFGGLSLTSCISMMSGAGKVIGSSTFNSCIGHTLKFEEVYFEYSGKTPVYENLSVKLYPILLITFQVVEMSCYAIIYYHLFKHHQEMIANRIISTDVYQMRKRKHLFTIYAQISGFLVEMIYLFVLTLVKMVGSRFFSKHMLESVNTLKSTEYGIVSTVQVFMSPDLRQKILLLLKRKNYFFPMTKPSS